MSAHIQKEEGKPFGFGWKGQSNGVDDDDVDSDLARFDQSLEHCPFSYGFSEVGNKRKVIRKRCVGAAHQVKSKPTWTRYYCKGCSIPLCIGDESGNCFAKHHSDTL